MHEPWKKRKGLIENRPRKVKKLKVLALNSAINTVTFDADTSVRFSVKAIHLKSFHFILLLMGIVEGFPFSTENPKRNKEQS